MERVPEVAQTRAMKGDGFYDAHARSQGEAGDLAGVPLLRDAVARVPLADAPGTVVDYGSAGGGNSIGPMAVAVDGIRQRVGDSKRSGGNGAMSPPQIGGRSSPAVLWS